MDNKSRLAFGQVEHELHGLHGFTRINIKLVFNSWIIKAGWPSARVEHELHGLHGFTRIDIPVF